MAASSANVPPFAVCPVPLRHTERVVMGHGSGGRLSHELLESVFVPAFAPVGLSTREDQATIRCAASHLAFTTDTFVVQPLFFPGGDIGSLAVHGTVNDLAVGGAVPHAIAGAFVLEEGFALSDLRRIAKSMADACRAAGVSLVTGDTKVVEHGKADGVFITTTGIGWLHHPEPLSVSRATPGDVVIVSGTLGDHGMAIMSVRENLAFESDLQSDSAPLADLAQQLLDAAPHTRCMRDPTRGGLASTLNEIAQASQVGIKLQESALPIRDDVRSACELLGFDPLYVANEGKLAAIVPPAQADAALQALRAHPLGANAAVIGSVVQAHPGFVTLRSLIGGERMVVMLAGEQLPRIC
jgi:hydrogenase expression/formation protein HypE